MTPLRPVLIDSIRRDYSPNLIHQCKLLLINFMRRIDKFRTD